MALSSDGDISCASASASTQLRDRQHHVGDAHDGLAQPAAAIAGQQAERHADQHGDADDGQRDRRGAARAQDDAREDVPAEIVGAERIVAAGRLEAAQQCEPRHPAGRARASAEHGQHQHEDDDRQHRAWPAQSRAACAGSRSSLLHQARIEQAVHDVDQDVDDA
jgi:hypothetical protein